MKTLNAKGDKQVTSKEVATKQDGDDSEIGIATEIEELSDNETTLTEKIGTLTSLQSDWYFLLCDRYPDSAFEIIDHFKAKRGGVNVVSFMEQSDAINHSDGDERRLYEAYTNAIDINRCYTRLDIVRVSKSVRKNLGLPAIVQNIATNAVAEFRRLFLVKELNVTNKSGDGTYQMYCNLVPIFVVDEK